ncbi:MAG: primosomal protein N' [Porticoccus sp.]|nr:primosomal protein N' [Porticoccus sp.]
MKTMNHINNQTIYQIAIQSPLRRLFDYLPPEDMVDASCEKILQPGVRVFVPFGKREIIGIVVGNSKKTSISISRLKHIRSAIDSESLIPEYLFDLYIWAADYYHNPIGDSLFQSIPRLLRKGKKLPSIEIQHWALTKLGMELPIVNLSSSPRKKYIISWLRENGPATKKEVKEKLISPSILKELTKKKLIMLKSSLISSHEIKQKNILAEKPQKLYPQQQNALKSIDLKNFHAYLLFGETGSGKTEVYLQAIEKVVSLKKQALVLIPEINLTPQTLSRFENRFNVKIAVLHSKLTNNERAIAWNMARIGKASIILGTRSAIFTPLKSPGIIIIDEEHDGSYKQQEGYRYSARDLAVIRAQKESIPIILGSATPSMESLNNCKENRYTKLILSRRPETSCRPVWLPINIRKSKLINGFSQELIDSIKKVLLEGNQALIFLNRRGFSPTLSCYDCGWISNCPNCEARLTVHKKPNRLLCHHCEYTVQVPMTCPSCDSSELEFIGQGTERIEGVLQSLFTNIQVLRIDRDTTRNKAAMQDVLSIVHSGDPCILIGTQMLAKGHHFPDVTLVAILDADGGLFSPDFRAPERMGQLITQVAGRSGRGNKPGSVIIQSNYCDHPFISSLIFEDYQNFINEIAKERHLSNLPPYGHMALIRAESTDNEAAINFLRYCRRMAENILPPSTIISYLGPLPASMGRKSGRFRHIFSIICKDRKKIQEVLTKLCKKVEISPLTKRIKWSIDVDPQDIS